MMYVSLVNVKIVHQSTMEIPLPPTSNNTHSTKMEQHKAYLVGTPEYKEAIDNGTIFTYLCDIYIQCTSCTDKNFDEVMDNLQMEYIEIMSGDYLMTTWKCNVKNSHDINAYINKGSNCKSNYDICLIGFKYYKELYMHHIDRFGKSLYLDRIASHAMHYIPGKLAFAKQEGTEKCINSIRDVLAIGSKGEPVLKFV